MVSNHIHQVQFQYFFFKEERRKEEEEEEEEKEDDDDDEEAKDFFLKKKEGRKNASKIFFEISHRSTYDHFMVMHGEGRAADEKSKHINFSTTSTIQG